MKTSNKRTPWYTKFKTQSEFDAMAAELVDGMIRRTLSFGGRLIDEVNLGKVFVTPDRQYACTVRFEFAPEIIPVADKQIELKVWPDIASLYGTTLTLRA